MLCGICLVHGVVARAEPPADAPPAQPAPPPPANTAPATPANAPATDAPPTTAPAPTAPGTAAASEPAATEPAVDDTQVARALFAEGLGLADAQRWVEASDCFRRVLAIRWSAAAAHNLGSALVELGRLVEAGEQLRLAARDAEADAEMRAASQRMLDAIEPQIGKLTIRLLGDREGVEVLLDGHPLPAAALDGPIRIDPGRHVVVARRKGTYVGREDLFLGSGAPRAMEVALDASPPPPEFEPVPLALAPAQVPPPGSDIMPTAPSARADSHDRKADRGDGSASWWLWLGGGVVVTGLVAVALGFGLGGDSAPAPIEGDLAPHVLRGQVGAP